MVSHSRIRKMNFTSSGATLFTVVGTACKSLAKQYDKHVLNFHCVGVYDGKSLQFSAENRMEGEETLDTQTCQDGMDYAIKTCPYEGEIPSYDKKFKLT